MSFTPSIDCHMCCLSEKLVTSQEPENVKNGKERSLVAICCANISRQPLCLVEKQLRYLPAAVLDDLKWYLSADFLTVFAELFQQHGINTSIVWQSLVCRRFGRKVQAAYEAGMPNNVKNLSFLIGEDICNPCMVYYSKHCARLLMECQRALVGVKRGDAKVKLIAYKDRHPFSILDGQTVESRLNSKYILPLSHEWKEEAAKEHFYLCDWMRKLESQLMHISTLCVYWAQLVFIIDSKLEGVLNVLQERLVNLELFSVTFSNFEIGLCFFKKIADSGVLKSLKIHDMLYGTPDVVIKLIDLFSLFGSDSNSCSTHEQEGTSLVSSPGVDYMYISDDDDTTVMESEEEILETNSDTDMVDLFDDALEPIAPQTNVGAGCLQDWNYIQKHVKIHSSKMDLCVNKKQKVKEADGETEEINSMSALTQLETVTGHVKDTGLVSLKVVFPHVSPMEVEPPPNPSITETEDSWIQLGQTLLNWSLLKRLDLSMVKYFRGSLRDVVVKVGCKHLTHLSLDMLHAEETQVFDQLMAVLFENYRSDDGCCQPLQYLALQNIVSDDKADINMESSYPYDVMAVKCLDLGYGFYGSRTFANLVHFIRHNKALTSLKMNAVFPPVESAASLFTSVLNHVTTNSILETLQLHFNEYFLNEYRNTISHCAPAIIPLLRTVSTLKILDLKECRLDQDFISDPDFVQALTHHRGLQYLCLDDNDLGAAAVVLLLEICSPHTDINLNQLSLDECKIPGDELVRAAEWLQKHTPRDKPFLKRLSINHNHVSVHQQSTIRNCLIDRVDQLQVDTRASGNLEFAAQM